MSDRSDHLIERAAALLRIANVGHVVDGNAKPGVATDKLPPTVASTEGSAGDRPMPIPALALPRPGIKPGQSKQALAQNRSVAELRATSKQAPVGIAALEQAGLMVARTNRTRTTEEYRIVIGRVLRALHENQESQVALGPDASPNVVMVTSARPGEGKSFTSLNLGGSIAQNAGESVLIVDVDAKNNSLSDMLGLSGRKGFLDLVADPGLLPDDLIVPSELPNLSFLPLGTRSIVREPGEGVGFEERRLTPSIKLLAQRFPGSLVLIDAPPCLSTSDPHTLSPAVGQVVLIVEAERTQRNEVEAAIEMVRVCPNITMLLNKVRMTSGHTFGSYDYFGSYT
jgi:protein-tyrosine kinase